MSARALRSSGEATMAATGDAAKPKPKFKLRDKARALRVPDGPLHIDEAGVIQTSPAIDAAVQKAKPKFSRKKILEVLRSPPKRREHMVGVPLNPQVEASQETAADVPKAIEDVPRATEAKTIDEANVEAHNEVANPEVVAPVVEGEDSQAENDCSSISKNSTDPSWCNLDVLPDAQDPHELSDDDNNTCVLDSCVPDSLTPIRITRAEYARAMAAATFAPSSACIPPQQVSQNAEEAVPPANDKSGRQLVDQDHVAQLVRDYWRHFAVYSKGKKRAVLQLIPKKVWEGVFSDYKKAFPNSTFKSSSLKDHLRDSLRDMKSGVNNSDDGQTAIAQDTDLMRQLMNTESWKARNVLKLRQDVMQGVARPPSDDSDEAVTIPTPPPSSTPMVPPSPSLSQRVPSRAQTPSTGRVPNVQQEQPPQNCAERGTTPGRQTTKSQNLKRAGEDLAHMMRDIKAMKEAQSSSSAQKKPSVESLQKLHEAKVQQSQAKRDEAQAKSELNSSRRQEAHARSEEAQARTLYQNTQNTLAQVQLLKEQKALGLLSETDFSEKCRALFGM